MNAISFIKHYAILLLYSTPIILTSVFNNNESTIMYNTERDMGMQSK